MKKDEKKEKPAGLSPFDEVELTDDEERALLLDLASMKHFHAIKRFFRRMDEHAVSVISTTDPFKDPTSLAKAQGTRVGYFSLEAHILQALEKDAE